MDIGTSIRSATTSPFGRYAGEPVMLFYEFCGGLRIQDMNNYLDGYLPMLPARYINKHMISEHDILTYFGEK